jgi:hypothetical protein
VAGELDEAANALLALADAVGELGDDGRAALAALVARDEDGLAQALADGTERLDVVEAAAATLEARLRALPMADPAGALRYSASTLARYEALAASVRAAEPLRPAWERLTAGVLPGAELTRRLLGHDEIAGEAVRLGGAGRYRQAMARLDEAVAELEAAREIRDRLAVTVDVTTLDDWLDRTADYDAALRGLWDALRRSDGLVTAGVREAAARERAARKLLPPDARALVVILGDVARGGLNQAVVEIEQVRGTLLDAVDRVGAVAAP